MNSTKFSKINYFALVRDLILIGFIFFFLYTAANYIIFNPADIKFQTSSIKIYDKQDNFLWEISKENSVQNTPVALNEIPASCKQGLISIEDRSFYSNIGIDIKGIGRLLISFVSNGSLGGGSTISQQVIKNYHNNIYNRNIVDKYREILYGIKLNSYYSKDKILEMYLNNVYFGDLNYGIGSAAENYFGKKVSELTLSECAYLAGIPQWPGIYNPNSNIEKGKKRQLQVLEAMADENYISKEVMSSAFNESLDLKIVIKEVRAPHFIQYIKDKYGFYTINSPSISELKTTYDYQFHKNILSLTRKDISTANLPDLNNAAVVVLDKKDLSVMIGSQDFFNDKINGSFNSALGLRQPGNTLKPLFFNYLIDYSKEINNPIANLTSENYINFENYLREFSPEDKPLELCDEEFLLKGCEISLFNLTQIYHLMLNGYKVNDINSQTNLNREPIDSELSHYFNLMSKEYLGYKIILGDTSNMKDTFAIATNGEYTIGVWMGNTKGEVVEGLNSESTSEVLSKDIINYILQK